MNITFNIFCLEKHIQAVSQCKYRNIFSQEYNIGFKFPAIDTCKTCDSLQIKMEHGSEQEKSAACISKELHLGHAESLKTKLHDFSKLANDDPSIHVISIDLQQTLPTPKLSSSIAFYSRILWTYDVGIHDCGQNTGHMLVWDESIAGRGSDEIGSCILKYIKTKGICAKKLVIFSDNCGGQNKNWNIMAIWS